MSTIISYGDEHLALKTFTNIKNSSAKVCILEMLKWGIGLCNSQFVCNFRGNIPRPETNYAEISFYRFLTLANSGQHFQSAVGVNENDRKISF